MKVKIIQSSSDSVFEDLVNDFLNKHRVDHVDVYVNVVQVNLIYTAVIHFHYLLEDLHFSTKINNVLRRNGIYTLDELVKAVDDNTISNCRTIGEKTIEEIRCKLISLKCIDG